ncbi:MULTISPECIES: hypothetical protein [unclassified Burkholderia]|uniref:hypothetical protein n=1 Tax=unclassified Burkholderia TaxID=2613784 RepID=UPI000F59AE24|nr:MULTISPECIES: hypothetical protein [unclassified Burkholderia]RQS22458.1 hypothetical protein DIE05_30015 [Burkholderia sp. Bp8995]RQS39232.1 hypothetical protein DIE00_34070 [Burkholderia sp. Bp8989]
MSEIHADAIRARMKAARNTLPEKLRLTPMKVRPMVGDLSRWKRLTQRDYLLWLVGTLQCVEFKKTRIDDARDVLERLGGMAAAW